MTHDPHIHLTLATDTPPEKLVLLAKYALQRAGVELPEVLQKATGTLQRRTRPTRAAVSEADSGLPHPLLDVYWTALERWAQACPAVIAEAVQTMADESLAKAIAWERWTFPLPAASWQRLRQLMTRLAAQAVAHLTGRAVPARHRVPGFTAPPVLWDVFGQATLVGMAHEPGAALTRQEQDAIAFARQHAGAKLRPLFAAQTGRLETALLEAERQAVRTGTTTALIQRQGPAELARALAQVQENFMRDWKRVGRTELVEAHNQGAVAAIIAGGIEQEGARQAELIAGVPAVKIFRIPSVNACLACQRLWLMPDGAPRLYDLHEVLANGSNEGRPAAEWLPVVGAQHPNCACPAPQTYTEAMELVFARMRHAAAIRQDLQRT